jgi:hypothetical protein
MSDRIEVDIDELPRWSPWPARLLNLEAFSAKKKTASEIDREYEREKWGPMLADYLGGKTPQNAADFIAYLHRGGKSAVVWHGGCLQLAAPEKSFEMLISLVQTELRPHLPAPAVVELGAGYGRIILTLLLSGFCGTARAMAAEYAPSGVELMRRLAASSGVRLDVASCDFTKRPITCLDIPPDSVIFTAFAVQCLPVLPDDFVDNLICLRPKAVIHIEPLYEHCQSSSLMQLMQRRYIEVNDYNSNLLTLLKRAEAASKIDILRESPRVFGANPFLVASVVSWRPIYIAADAAP